MDLMTAFHFTPEDLAANRQGQFSNAQRAWIAAQVNTNRITPRSIAIGVGLLAVILLVALAALSTVTAGIDSGGMDAIFAPMFSLAMIIMLGLIVLLFTIRQISQRRAEAAILQGGNLQIKDAAGRIHLERVRGGFSLRVEQLLLAGRAPISGEAQDLLEPEGVYRVYYAALSGQDYLFSIEQA